MELYKTRLKELSGTIIFLVLVGLANAGSSTVP